MTLLLTTSIVEQIRQLGEQLYPDEGAGMLLGTVEDGDRRRIEQVIPLTNRWEPGARRRRYRIEPRDLMAAEDRAEQAGLLTLGIFHSHPDHPAVPSTFDLEQAFPFYSYLITRVEAGGAGESRAWRLAKDRSRFDEEDLGVLPHHQGER